MSLTRHARVLRPRNSSASRSSCRGYLLQLEREGILSPLQREIVIDRLVALDGDEVDIDRLKWLVLMVLSSQPGQEQACARMEHLVFEDPDALSELAMADNLVIVESPAKAKTIKKYLGKDFEVLASYGHVRDLIPKEGAVDPDKHFAMSYQSIERNEKHVDAIARALKKSKNLYLATDPDREGEAISWHLRELLRERGDLKGKDVKRVVFYEITKGEVQRAVAEPRDLSLDLVNAQQARRALDYLVGFNLSPLLWKKVRRGLSAGRVQSPALRMICEREHEISIFKPQEYWTLEAEGEHSAQTFPLKLVEFNGQKVEQFSFTNEAAARGVEQSIKDAAQGFLHVISIDRKQRRRNPSPPFTTSTLQQEAARKLGYSAQRTMRLAQQLYEGVDFGEGSIGLITYMRTDSVNLADDADARDARSHREGIRQGSAWPKSRASTRPSRAMRRKRTKPFARPPRPSCRRGSKARSIPTSSSCTRSSGSVPWRRRWRTRCSTPSPST